MAGNPLLNMVGQSGSLLDAIAAIQKAAMALQTMAERLTLIEENVKVLVQQQDRLTKLVILTLTEEEAQEIFARL